MKVPTQTQSSRDRFFRQAGEFRPFNERQALALEFIAAIRARISHLRCLGGPAHVAWSVISVVVDAIYAVLRRARPHESEEAFKGLELSRHFDTPGSIVLIAGILGILTTAPHGAPNPVLAAFPFAVLCGGFANFLRLKATAGASVPVPQMITPDKGVLETAATDADPLNSTVRSIRSTLYRREQAESLAGEVISQLGARTARDGMPATQIIAVTERFSAANTTAMPSSMAVCGIRPPSQNRQVSERAAREIVQIVHAIALRARRSMAAQQISLMHQPSSAACAAAKPSGFAAGTVGTASKHRESAKCLTFKISGSHRDR